MKTALELKIIFDRVNTESESFVPFSDIEYYSEQIQNIFDYPESDCIRLAQELATL